MYVCMCYYKAAIYSEWGVAIVATIALRRVGELWGLLYSHTMGANKTHPQLREHLNPNV